MATTVKYKGSTLTTATNQTKILKTAGKYMEDDVTIEDVTSGGSAVVVTEETDAGGGIIKHITAIDLSNDTVDAAHLYQGYTAHNFQGEAIVGTMSGGGTPINNQNKTVTPSTAQQSVTYDNGYTGLGTVTVQAMPTGTAGTPTAAKSAVSNHTITITPSVTNSAGYISSGTKTGTAVTVSASELVSGTRTIIGSGQIDVADYAYASVAAGTEGTPTATKGTVSSHAINITPSVTNEYGWILGGTKTGTAVTVSASELVSGTLNITTNGTKDVTNYASVSVNVSGGGVTLQSKSVSFTPTESAQSSAVTPDTGYDGLSEVNISVAAISSTYVGTGITRRGSSDLTVSGATVTVPSGFYASQATKSVTTMTLPTSAASTSTTGYTSKATIGRSTSNQYINIPPGYNSTGAYYTISSTPNGTVTAPATITGTTATVTTGTNTLTLTKTVSVTPNVTTAGYISTGTAGNASVSLTASVTTKAAATITPGTTNQTIASGTYLTGTQTISGDANLVGSNILSGKSIFGVNGTVTFQTYYTGSTTPAASLGSNGDIYLQS